MSEHFALGIDIGTTAVKVLLISGNGRIVMESSRGHDLFSEHSDWAEEDADIWWQNVQDAVREVAIKYPTEISQLWGIGVSGMVPALVFLDCNKKVLRKTIQQNDARCTEEIKELKEIFDQKELFKHTGGYTNQQHLLPRLLWVKKHEPEIYKKIWKVIGSYDYITYKLTGVLEVEKNWAVESGAYDIFQQKWIDEFFWKAGIDQSLVPDVYDSLQVVGYTGEQAALIGLPTGIKVIAGSADHVASALAAGIVDTGDLLIKFGGAGDVLYCINEVAPLEKMFFDYHVIQGKYLINGCTATSGSLLKWLVRNLLKEENPDAFKNFDREADDIPACSHGLVVLPYFLGEKTPLFDPEASGVICGLKLSTTREDIYHAVLESVIFSFKHHIDVLKESGYDPQNIMATDGGARSPLWCQIAADILGKPIKSFPNHPGSALGVAFAAGIASGVFTSWNEINKFLTEYRLYFPDSKNNSVYDEGYKIYRDVYESLKEENIFHRLTSLSTYAKEESKPEK